MTYHRVFLERGGGHRGRIAREIGVYVAGAP